MAARASEECTSEWTVWLTLSLSPHPPHSPLVNTNKPGVGLALKMPASHAAVPACGSRLCCRIQTLGSNGDGSSDRAPATHVGDQATEGSCRLRRANREGVLTIALPLKFKKQGRF